MTTIVTVLPRTRFAVNAAGVATDLHNTTHVARFAVTTTGTTTDLRK